MRHATYVTSVSLAALLGFSVFAAAAPAESADAISVVHLAGVPALKSRAKAKLTVEGGALHLAANAKDAAKTDIAASSIEEIFAGTETTQGGGAAGSAAKVGSMDAPYGAGAALVLILRTKVDLLTVLYRGSEGELHSVLLSVPKGKATDIRDKLVAAGARKGNQ